MPFACTFCQFTGDSVSAINKHLNRFVPELVGIVGGHNKVKIDDHHPALICRVVAHESQFPDDILLHGTEREITVQQAFANLSRTKLDTVEDQQQWAARTLPKGTARFWHRGLTRTMEWYENGEQGEGDLKERLGNVYAAAIGRTGSTRPEPSNGRSNAPGKGARAKRRTGVSTAGRMTTSNTYSSLPDLGGTRGRDSHVRSRATNISGPVMSGRGGSSGQTEHIRTQTPKVAVHRNKIDAHRKALNGGQGYKNSTVDRGSEVDELPLATGVSHPETAADFRYPRRRRQHQTSLGPGREMSGEQEITHNIPALFPRASSGLNNHNTQLSWKQSSAPPATSTSRSSSTDAKQEAKHIPVPVEPLFYLEVAFNMENYVIAVGAGWSLGDAMSAACGVVPAFLRPFMSGRNVFVGEGKYNGDWTGQVWRDVATEAGGVPNIMTFKVTLVVRAS